MTLPLPLTLQLAASHGHKVFTEGDLNLNIIGVRSPTKQAGEFDDLMTVTYKARGRWVTRTWPMTTDPGVYWLEHPIRHMGAAIMYPGQYRGAYKVGTHKGKPALVQAKPVTVFRDNNRDDQLNLDPGVPLEQGMFGINIHRGGTDSRFVGRWSAGCQVFKREADFLDFLGLCKRAAEKWGNSFTYTLVPGP